MPSIAAGGPDSKGFTCCPPNTTGCYGSQPVAGVACCAAGETCVTTSYGYQVAPYCGACLTTQPSFTDPRAAMPWVPRLVLHACALASAAAGKLLSRVDPSISHTGTEAWLTAHRSCALWWRSGMR